MAPRSSLARWSSALSVLFLSLGGWPALGCAGDRFKKADDQENQAGDDPGGSSSSGGRGTGGRGTGGVNGTGGAGTSSGESGNDGSGGSGNDGSGGSGNDGSGGSGNDGSGGSGNDGGSTSGDGGSRSGSGGASGVSGSSPGGAGAGGAGNAGGGGSAGAGVAGAGGTGGGTYPSCLALHEAEPTLPSGTYTIRPALANAAFPVYCEMTTQGGGWTLAFNQSTSFVPTEEGSVTSVCHTDACTNRSYSTVPVGEDVMLDLDTLPITGNVYLARAVVIGVHGQTRGRTLRQLMTTGPAYLEREDNANIFVTVNDPLGCAALPGEFAFIICNDCDDPSGDPCGVPVITLGDSDSLCDSVRFAIGASRSYSLAWGNCSGWPPGPSWGLGGFPGYFRLWVR